MNSKHRYDSRAAASCLALSLLAHLVFAAPLDFLKSFELGTPVRRSQPIVVDLSATMPTRPAGGLLSSPPAIAAPVVLGAPETDRLRTAIPAAAAGPAMAASKVASLSPPPLAAQQSAALPPAEQPTEQPSEQPSVWPTDPAAGRAEAQKVAAAITQGNKVPTEAPLPPIRSADEFLASDRETLSYRISMLGIPVGTGELSATQEKSEVRINLSIRSNAAISRLYPVDDWVETRLIGGDFILGRIRQQEGSFRGDRGFTLFLRDKKVFWIDRLKNRSLLESLPNGEVVDILSGLYYLRRQPLEVGKSVTLQLFDSNRYAPTTVAVLRKERLTLPGMREVDTLLVQPQLKTEGIFQRTGDILVWLTDDENKAPVKVETRISLGKVTAELVSARTHGKDEAPDRVAATGKNP